MTLSDSKILNDTKHRVACLRQLSYLLYFEAETTAETHKLNVGENRVSRNGMSSAPAIIYSYGAPLC